MNDGVTASLGECVQPAAANKIHRGYHRWRGARAAVIHLSNGKSNQCMGLENRTDGSIIIQFEVK
jgi:hypothetical protein